MLRELEVSASTIKRDIAFLPYIPHIGGRISS